MSPPSTFRQALRMSGRYLVVFVVLGGGLFVVIRLFGIALPTGLFGTMLAVKIGFVSLLTAVATFLQRTFWDEAKLSDETKFPEKKEYLRKIVSYYTGYFLLLFGAMLAAILAILADFVTATGSTDDVWRALSLAAFSTAMVLLVGFLLYFVGRALAEMRTLLDTTR